MAKDLKDIVNNCTPCQSLRPANRKEPLIQHEMGEKPWDKRGLDLFEIENRTYLVLVDYFSNFIEVEYLSNPTSGEVIKKVKSLCARYGIPKVLISDNGPQLASREFSNFTRAWNICHQTSSPRYPRSNGKAEAAVKTIKHMMIKAIQNETDPYLALLELRNTPRQDSGVSPASVVFGQDTRSIIPSVINKPAYTPDQVQTRIQRRKHTIKRHHNKTCHSRPQVNKHDPILFKKTATSLWEQGQVKERVNERSMIISTKDGGEYRRNTLHIRPDHSTNAGAEQDDQTREHDACATQPAAEQLIDHDNAANPTTSPLVRPTRTRKPPIWLKDYN